uniref:DUF4139 domain-containing protein n=1 Tax=Setaria digitata TaxID=48799 RepID=A0A915Q7C8_9BILA
MVTEAAVIAVHKFQSYNLEIHSVTIYNDFAIVKRKITTTLKTGLNEIIIENISPMADKDSIMINGHGDAIIHGIKVDSVPVLPDESSAPRLQQLKNEIKELKNQKRLLNDRQRVLGKNEQLLDSVFEKVSGTMVQLKDNEGKCETTLDHMFENITRLISFHDQKHFEINKNIRDIDEEIHEIDQKLRKIHDQINLSEESDISARNVCIMLKSENDNIVDLNISYQVSNASWEPIYAIEVGSATNTFKITYFGNIRQNTGEDWTNAPLILSTAQSAFSTEIPRLGTLIAEIRKTSPRLFPGNSSPQTAMFRKSSLRRQTVGVDNYKNHIEFQMAQQPELLHAPVASTESVTSAVFTIAKPISIRSDSNDHKVVIANITLTPILCFESIPCKSTNVYLTAYATNESLMPFLAGQAFIYLDDNFVTKSSLKAVSPGERFKCSLGVDPAIKIEYKPVNKYTIETGLMTKSETTMNEQKILIRNTKSTVIFIAIHEHMPKSTDEKIKIKLFLPELDKKDGEIGISDMISTKVGAHIDANHNLTWIKKIEPNMEEVLLIKWSIERPKEEVITFHEVFSFGNLD